MSYLTNAALQHPQVASEYNEINDLAQKKLWFQLTRLLLSLSRPSSSLSSKQEFFQQSPHLYELWEHFIVTLSEKLNSVDYAELAIHSSRQLKQPIEQYKFLQKIHSQLNDTLKQSESVENESNESKPSSQPKKLQSLMTRQELKPAITLLNLELTRVLLHSNQTEVDQLRGRLQEDKRTIDYSTIVMPSVIYSQYYLTALEFYKAKGPPNKYFENAMLYLQYNPIETLPKTQQSQLAYDIATAALLGNEIYNFGELLQQKELMNVLDQNENTKRLSQLLRIFNDGRITEFDSLFKEVSQTQPLLKIQQSFLFQKLRIMTVLERVSRKAANDRLLSFDEIKQITGLKTDDEIEFLIIKALALKVVKGIVDQIDRTVRFEWVQPRVLSKAEIRGIQTRLNEWSQKISEAERYIEDNGQALFV